VVSIGSKLAFSDGAAVVFKNESNEFLGLRLMMGVGANITSQQGLGGRVAGGGRGGREGGGRGGRWGGGVREAHGWKVEDDMEPACAGLHQLQCLR